MNIIAIPFNGAAVWRMALTLQVALAWLLANDHKRTRMEWFPRFLDNVDEVNEALERAGKFFCGE